MPVQPFVSSAVEVTHERDRSRATYPLLLLGILGFAARLALALISTGSNDAVYWHEFVVQIDQHGVGFMYEHVRIFNHPPLMGYLAQVALRVSQALDLPFALIFKLPAIFADGFTAMLLWRIWSRAHGSLNEARAVLAYGWSLVAILVSAYHGNTDNLAAFLCLLAAYLLERQRPLAGGLALAAAINVKLIPVLLIPLFVSRERSWRALASFGVGLSVGVIPFVPFLICCGSSFYRNAIAYNSILNNWGIMMFLFHAPKVLPITPETTLALRELFVPNGRYVVFGLIMLLAAWSFLKRRWSYYELGAMGFAIFLIATPGFAVQYTVYVCPLLFAVSLRHGTIYSLLAGLCIGIDYYSYWDGALPLFSNMTRPLPVSAALVGLVAWLFLVYVVGVYLYRESK